jgi:hypothetical protein
VLQPHDGSVEWACLSFGNKVLNDPELTVRWLPICLKEMKNHLGTCLFPVDEEFRNKFPHIKPSEWIMPLQEKRNKQTGGWEKDKARLAICGNIELAAGKHPDPTLRYAPQLNSASFKLLLSHATYKGHDISKLDSTSAFQHTPASFSPTRTAPVVLLLPPQLTGEEESKYYYLTTLFQGLPEASRAWFDFTMSIYCAPPCNMIPSTADPCVLIWRGPPTPILEEQGEYFIGISTDDNLETTSPNKAGRDHCLVVRQAMADNGIPTTSEELPDQNIGVAISYDSRRSTTLRPTQQIAD